MEALMMFVLLVQGLELVVSILYGGRTQIALKMVTYNISKHKSSCNNARSK